MFTQNLKYVLRKLNVSDDTYKYVMEHHGNIHCSRKIGATLNYYDLYNTRSDNIIVIQKNKTKTIFNMNPFCKALILVNNKHTYTIHKFHPGAFSEAIFLRQKEDIIPNFKRYNIFLPDGSRISCIDDLNAAQEFFAVSKQTFYGYTKSEWYPYDHPVHMYLHWARNFIVTK